MRATCLQVGITFDPWQEGAGTAILGKTVDRLYAADAVVFSIPRQVGKTFLIGAIIFALCLQTSKTLVLWTAHRYVTAADTFNDLKALAERRKLKPHIKRITTATGNQAIEFNNGSKILFGARERGFGRGFKKVAIIVFDEAQILTENAIDDMVPSTNRHPNPLIIYIGTPPKPSDPGAVFTNLREEALSGETDTTLYIEMSADKDADPNDREQWRKANPSYPRHTSTRAMLRMKKNLTPQSFLLEALGIWNGTATVGVFNAGAWGRTAKAGPAPAPAALGIAADADQVWLSLGAAGAVTRDKRQHVGAVLRVRADQPHLVDGQQVFGENGELVTERAFFISEVKRIQTEHRCVIGIDAKGPASDLIPDLEAAGVDLIRLGLDDVVQAAADITTAVNTETIEHGHYEELDDAVDAAQWKKSGDRRVLARRNGDISMLEAVTFAAWATRQATTFAMYGGGDLELCDKCGKRPHEDPDGEHGYLCLDCREA